VRSRAVRLGGANHLAVADWAGPDCRVLPGQGIAAFDFRSYAAARRAAGSFGPARPWLRPPAVSVLLPASRAIPAAVLPRGVPRPRSAASPGSEANRRLACHGWLPSDVPEHD